MTLFTVGEEINHRAGDATCAECWEEYPEHCRCGGLIHAAGGDADDEDGNLLLVTQCDRCERTEEQLEEG